MSNKDNTEVVENIESVEAVEEGQAETLAEESEPEVKTTSNAFTRAMKKLFTSRPVEPVAVSVGDWLIVRALRCLPVIQIIPILIWCFGKYPPSQKNWARAELIWIIAKILLIVVFILILKAIFRF